MEKIQASDDVDQDGMIVKSQAGGAWSSGMFKNFITRTPLVQSDDEDDWMQGSGSGNHLQPFSTSTDQPDVSVSIYEPGEETTEATTRPNDEGIFAFSVKKRFSLFQKLKFPSSSSI
ncbi:hypothetical protein Tsp_03756 [Trichinella spiralis]|uniref:hypothetical protein n=1 Tax=Trichinella spiralis TaxID=6334 RepID=UPI0001EFBD03|nr:hypothetical protein Tsp_03756 [Trichinella spiralis]